MFEYITTAILELFTGRVGLSEKQAARRLPVGSIKPVKKQKRVYEILAPVQFKSGEIIGLENPDKVTLSKVELTPRSQKLVDKIAADEKQAEIDAEVEKRLAEKEAKEKAAADKKAAK